VNERQRQTYFELWIIVLGSFGQSLPQGQFWVHYWVFKVSASKLSTTTSCCLWDGASYHRSVELKTYKRSIRTGHKTWAITCTRFAPNAPEQNPVEDLVTGETLCPAYHLRKSFAVVKFLFRDSSSSFDFPKLSMYGIFSWFIQDCYTTNNFRINTFSLVKWALSRSDRDGLPNDVAVWNTDTRRRRLILCPLTH